MTKFIEPEENGEWRMENGAVGRSARTSTHDLARRTIKNSELYTNIAPIFAFWPHYDT